MQLHLVRALETASRSPSAIGRAGKACSRGPAAPQRLAAGTAHRPHDENGAGQESLARARLADEVWRRSTAPLQCSWGKAGSWRRIGMRLTIQRKARTPMVTSVTETQTSIQLGT